MSDNQENKRQHDGEGAEQQAKRVRWDYDYDDLITVIVGKEEARFQVHKDTICERSKFFEAAVSTDRWLEGQEKLVRLPEANARSFKMYVHWMYSGKLVPEVFWERDDVSPHCEPQAYFYAYILGDLLADSGLCEGALDICISKSIDWRNIPSGKVCERVWDRTPKGSPLRTFILEWMVSSMAKSEFTGFVEWLPRELLEEAFVLLMSFEDTSRGETPQGFADRIRAKLLPERM